MDPLRPTAPRQPPGTGGAGGDGWHIGQRLTAVVLRGSEAGGEAQLRIGRQIRSVRSQLPLVQGDHLTIEVTRLAPSMMLRLIGPDQAAAGSGTVPAQAALRALLPRQAGMGPLFAALSAARAGAEAPGSATLRQAVDALLDSLTGSDRLDDASALRRALFDTGLLFDARTAAGENPQNDLKGLLLRLLRATAQADPHAGSNAATPSTAHTPPPARDGSLSAQPRVHHESAEAHAGETLPARLHQLADGALARTALHQLSSVDGGRAGAFVLHGELPIRDRAGVDVVHFRIRREAQKARRGGDRGWTVSLALDLPGLGPLHVRIGLQGHSVATHFWAEHEATRRTIEHELPALASALNRCGLEAAALSCHTGTPPSGTPAPSGGGLLDTRV